MPLAAFKFGIVRPLKHRPPYYASRKIPFLPLALPLHYHPLPFFLLHRCFSGRKKCDWRECAPWSLTSHTSRRLRRRKRGAVHSYYSFSSSSSDLSLLLSFSLSPPFPPLFLLFLFISRCLSILRAR